MAAPTTDKPPGLSLDFLPSVDMTTLTQSELRSLSSFSSSSFDPGRTGEITTPTVDGSSFNESTGSHRQTYSRPFSYHHHHRHRSAALVPKAPNPPSPIPPASNESLIDAESRCIVQFLKKLLCSRPEFQQLDLLGSDCVSNVCDAINISPPAAKSEVTVVSGDYGVREKKRRRGRKPKMKSLNVVVKEKERVRETGLEIVNRNGVAVDLVSLASMEDPYKDELSRRTQGMDKDEELLGFFGDLEGQWCNRRRKRKIVDASEFGDALPIGWKLLLGIKRKGGRAWVYCRRYISPGGQHFVSCKEVSKYLQTIFKNYDPQHMMDYAGSNTQRVHKVVSNSSTVATRNNRDQKQSGEHEKPVALLETKKSDFAEVQVTDTFECHKCSMVFSEKGTYLEHLLSFHERATRRHGIGSSVGEGVIIRDGKYECQFCHKVFDERRRYSGHVGVHVRNYVQGIEESPGDQMALQKTSDFPKTNGNDALPPRISRMDALIEIAQSSIQETSTGLNGEASGTVTSEPNVIPDPELPALVLDHGLQPDSSPKQHQEKADGMIIDGTTQKIDDSDTVLHNEINSSGNLQHGYGYLPPHDKDPTLNTVQIDNLGIEPKTDKHDDCRSDVVDRTEHVEMEVDFQSSDDVADNTVVEVPSQQPLEEDGLSSVQPSLTFSATTVSLDEIDPSAIDKRDNRITGFEDLKLEEFEQLKFGFNNEIEVPVNLVNNSEIDRMFDASVPFESDLAVDNAGGRGLTTQCIWCGIDFNHEGIDTDMQSDSVGYMCPTCKDKMSGPLNVLGGGCS